MRSYAAGRKPIAVQPREGSDKVAISAASGILVAFAAILAWTILVNIPTFAFEDADDGFFLEVGHLWNQGLPPYVGAFDVKGPGGFALVALATLLFGPTLAALKILGVLSSAVAGTALYWMCARYDRAAAVLCALIYPIAMIACGDVVYETMNAALLIAFAIAFCDPAGPAKAMAAGLAVGAACAIKQTCAVDALAVVYILWSKEAPKADRVRAVLAFSSAIPAVPLGFFLYYASRGDAGILLQDVVGAALLRGSAAPLGTALHSLADCFFPVSVIFVVACMAGSNFAKLATRFPIRAMTVWAAVELTAIVVQTAGCRTYVTPLVAPLLMIASIYVSESYRREGRNRRAFALGLFGVAAFCGVMAGHGAAILRKMTGVDYELLSQVKATIADTRPQEDDRLLVVNGAAFANIVTDRRPPTPIFHWAHILCDFPGAGFPALVDNFEAKPRYVVFENPDKRPSCQPESYRNEIDSALKENYLLISQGRTGRSAYQVFEREK